jgi:hypothetical protein
VTGFAHGLGGEVFWGIVCLRLKGDRLQTTVSLSWVIAGPALVVVVVVVVVLLLLLVGG